MKNHRETLLLLYDYCEGTLAEDERASVEEHLRECAGCSAELESLKEAREVLTPADGTPADRLPESYWTGFANSVEASLPNTGPRRLTLPHAIAGIPLRRRLRHAIAFAGALATCAIVFLLLREPGPGPAPSTEVRPGLAELPVDTVGLRMERYLKRSKALLVGLHNAELGETAPLPPAVERRLSRQLAEEARLLRRQPLDPRGSRLVDDLEKIFIGLANAGDEQWKPAVEIVRAGVEEENLLFKIRMAESAYGHARIIPVSASR